MPWKMRFFSFLFLSLLVPGLLHAQSSTLQGQVFDAVTETPIAGVHLYLAHTSLGTTSAADGTFHLPLVPHGTYTLITRALGYAPLRQSVSVTEQTAPQYLMLEEHTVVFEEIVVERTSLTGRAENRLGLPGSAHYLGPRMLEKYNYTDINRMLRSVPGVNIQEEDGYGLRPNIGLRGTGVERSSKITIMEDGILTAPAPYAAPAAYYFPTAGRMQGLEVRKGSSQIKYGPYTTGGALNLISTPIPESFSARARLFAGNDANRTLHASVGTTGEHVGFLIETYQIQTDGFKHLDTGGSTGFDKKDYLAKFRLNTRPDARVYQALNFKIGRDSETSNETYLGLTDTDFKRAPYRRYAGSQADVMETSHEQYVLQHVIRPTQTIDITTSLYRTEFSRNWYKLDRVRASSDGPRIPIGNLLAHPETYATEYAIVAGADSPNDNALEVKANNRAYYAQGIQTVAGFALKRGPAKHDFEIGLRYHEDEMDRFQWVDAYRMNQGFMTLTHTDTPGTESNRIESASAWATFLQYRLTHGRWSLLPGLRYENITLNRRDYGKTDPDRTGLNLSERTNAISAWMPGFGLDYKLNEGLHTFVGLHKGFSPPGSQPGTRPEESLNYEAGLRYRSHPLHAEAIGFWNDYANLLGADLASSGGQGTSDQFNGGAVLARGLETALGYNFGDLINWQFSLPLKLTYTYTKATFSHTFESDFDPWGSVEDGDALPYIPLHQWSAAFGVEHTYFDLELSAKYVDAMRTQAGQGPLDPVQSTDAHLVWDAAGTLRLSHHTKLFASLRNLTDAVYIVARRPAGIRPGQPRHFVVGLKSSF